MKFKFQCLYCYCYCYVASVVPDSVQPHRWQPTRLPYPWDSPGKNTGVGCHFLLQCMKVESESEVTQLYPTLSDPMDCSLSGSSIHGIFQARVLEWGAIAFSMSISKVLMKYGHACLITILYGFFFFSTEWLWQKPQASHHLTVLLGERPITAESECSLRVTSIIILDILC